MADSDPLDPGSQDTAPSGTDTAPEDTSADTPDTASQGLGQDQGTDQPGVSDELLDTSRLLTPAQQKKLQNDYKVALGRLRSMGKETSQVGERTRTNAAAWEQATSEVPGFLELMEGHLSNDPNLVQQALSRMAQHYGVGTNQGAGQAQRGQGTGRQQSKYQDILSLPADKFNDGLLDVVRQVIREEMEPHLGSVYRDLSGMKMEGAMAALQKKGLVDLPKYREQIAELMSQDTSGRFTPEDLYYIAKGRANGFGRPRPNPAGAVSEMPAGMPRSPSEGDQVEALKRAILNSGSNGSL